MFRTTSLVRARIGHSASQLCDLQQLLCKVQQLEMEKAELQSQISCGSSGVAMTKGKPDPAAAAAQTVATPTRSKEPETTPSRSKEPETSPTRSKEPETTPTRSKEPVFHSPVPRGPSLVAVLNGVEIKTQAHPVPKPSADAIGLECEDGDERVNSQTHRKEYMKLAAWISLCGYICMFILHADHVTAHLSIVAMKLVHWPSTPTCWHCKKALSMPHDCID